MEGGCHGRKVKRDFRGDVLDVESDDLLFQEEQMFDQEEVSISWRSSLRDGVGRGNEGQGCLMDDLMCKIVEYRGL